MRCYCGAKWRVNFPFGKKSKSITSFAIPHKPKCAFRKKKEKNATK